MKHVIHASLSLFLWILLQHISISTYAQTNRHNNLHNTEHIWKLKKQANNKYVGVGNGGTILQYENHCNDWLSIGNATIDDDFRNASFPSEQVGYISGASNGLYKTTNGGLSWTAITPATTGLTNASIQCIHFINDTTGFIAGSQIGVSGGGRFILRTTNGGLSWNNVTPTTIGTTTIYDMVFVAPQIGIAVGTNNKAFRTTDNGLTWTDHTSGATLYSIAALDATTVVAVANGNIARSTNQGLTWTAIANTGSGLQGVHFYDALHGMTTGSNGLVLYTQDGGLTWSSVATLQSTKVYDVVMTDVDKAICVGAGGMVFDIDVTQNYHHLFEEHFCNPVDDKTYYNYTNMALVAAPNDRKWFFNNVNENNNGLEAAQWFPGKFAIYDASFYEDSLQTAATDSAYIETRTLNFSGVTELALSWNEAFYTHPFFATTTVIEGYNGNTWITLYKNAGIDFGDDVASATFPSHKRVIDITALAGVSNAKLRFRYHAGNTNDALKNYWAISDIVVSNQTVALDISTDVTAADTCYGNTNTDIEISINNTGDLTVFPLTIQWTSSDGQHGANAYYEALAPNATYTDIAIVGFMPPTSGGVIDFKIWIQNMPNQNLVNDTLYTRRTFQTAQSTVGILGNDTILCPDKSITLAVAADAYPVLWSTGDTTMHIQAISGATYTVQAQWGACLFSDTIVVQAYDVLPPTITLENDALVCAPNNYASYAWYKNGELIPNSNSNGIIPTAAGAYTVKAITTEGCEIVSLVYNYNPVGITEWSAPTGLLIYPQPAQDNLYITLPVAASVVSVQAYDITGRALEALPWTTMSDKVNINTNKLLSGIYYVQLNTTSSYYKFKVVIQ
jgi:photosystem II stability/assembly factor-like uncharacterized protein